MERNVREYTLTRTCLYREITARVLFYPEGIHVSLFGGDLPHIGAVSITDTKGKRTDLVFPGHREDTITVRWSAVFLSAGLLPAVVEAGIHYDGISKEEILEVLNCCDAILSDILRLAEKKQPDTTRAASPPSSSGPSLLQND